MSDVIATQSPGYIIVDTEGSGLFDYKQPADAPGQPRLAEIVLLFANSDLELERTYHALIKPDDWVMQSGATEVNGLTTEYLMEHGVPVREALDVYLAAIDEGREMAAHNAQHDAKQIRAELRRAGLPDRFEEAPNLCTMRNLTNVCQVPNKNGRKGFKWPSLAEACEFFGIQQAAQHSAISDATDCLNLLRRMKAIGVLPEAKVHYAKNPPQKLDAQ